MKITSRYKIKSETMIALSRQGYSNEFLAEKEKIFLEWAHLKELDEPDALFSERVRRFKPDVKKERVEAVEAPEGTFSPDNNIKKDALEAAASMIAKRYPQTRRDTSAFWDWVKKQRERLDSM